MVSSMPTAFPKRGSITDVLFDSIDADKDGIISRAEFRTALKSSVIKPMQHGVIGRAADDSKAMSSAAPALLAPTALASALGPPVMLTAPIALPAPAPLAAPVAARVGQSGFAGDRPGKVKAALPDRGGKLPGA